MSQQHHPQQRFAAIVLYDDPECAGAAEAFSTLANKLPSAPNPEAVAIEVFLVPANANNLAATSNSLAGSTSGNNNNVHADVLLDALRGLVNYRPSELCVIGLLKDSNASVPTQKIREVCNDTRPAITECHIATHLANFGDVGLVVRNLVRKFHEAASRGIPAATKQ